MRGVRSSPPTPTPASAPKLARAPAPSRQGVDREPVYNPELGLAVEMLKDGLTVEQLWSVL